MLEDIEAIDQIKGVFRERVGEDIQIMDNIGL